MFVLMVDQKNSRRSTDRIETLLAWLTTRDEAFVRPFERTAGDEVQGILSRPGDVVSLVLALVRQDAWERRRRCRRGQRTAPPEHPCRVRPGVQPRPRRGYSRQIPSRRCRGVRAVPRRCPARADRPGSAGLDRGAAQRAGLEACRPRRDRTEPDRDRREGRHHQAGRLPAAAGGRLAPRARPASSPPTSCPSRGRWKAGTVVVLALLALVAAAPLLPAAAAPGPPRPRPADRGFSRRCCSRWPRPLRRRDRGARLAAGDRLGPRRRRGDDGGSNVVRAVFRSMRDELCPGVRDTSVAAARADDSSSRPRPRGVSDVGRRAPDRHDRGVDSHRPETVLRGGAWIGFLERAAVAATLLAGWPEGIALVLAVKGVGRYSELRETNAPEAFIIGTFASLLWAGRRGRDGPPAALSVRVRAPPPDRRHPVHRPPRRRSRPSTAATGSPSSTAAAPARDLFAGDDRVSRAPATATPTCPPWPRASGTRPSTPAPTSRGRSRRSPTCSASGVAATCWSPASRRTRRRSPAGFDEDSPLAELDDPTVEEVTETTYGGLKVLCERAAVDRYGPATLIVRPTYVVGPDDYTWRFPWWVTRLARGGEVLVPGPADDPAQVIDVRDMAAWMVGLLEDGHSGAFHAVSPAPPFSWRDAAGGRARRGRPGGHDADLGDGRLPAAEGLDEAALPLWSADDPAVLTMARRPGPGDRHRAAARGRCPTRCATRSPGPARSRAARDPRGWVPSGRPSCCDCGERTA